MSASMHSVTQLSAHTKRRLPLFLILFIGFLSAGRLPGITRTHPSKPVQGLLFHLCSCPLPCPCMFTNKDVDGCNIVRIYHITDGGYLGKQIVGKTIIAIPVPKELKQAENAPETEGSKIDAAWYIPSDMPPKQARAFWHLVADTSGNLETIVLRPAKITFQKTTHGYEVKIPDVFEARIVRATGTGSKQMVVDNLPLPEGSRWFLGRAKTHTYQDKQVKDWKWSYSDDNGSWTHFIMEPYTD